jgi:hypothetical protein
LGFSVWGLRVWDNKTNIKKLRKKNKNGELVLPEGYNVVAPPVLKGPSSGFLKHLNPFLDLPSDSGFSLGFSLGFRYRV